MITTPDPDHHATDRRRAAALLRSAFRDLHGARLHGFALLVTLGDRAAAAATATRALAAGAAEADALRHPERAAAWLRARVVRDLPRRAARPRGAALDARRHALGGLGLADAAFEGLAALTTLERAGLVAADIERLEPRDVETVVGLGPAASRRLLAAARRRYVGVTALAVADSPPRPAGELAVRVNALAEQTVGGSSEGAR